jgi:hydrogenase maturation protease
LGNDIISDDGFGPAVARSCRPVFESRPDVAVEEASVAGFHLLDILVGFRRVLIVDVVRTGTHAPGTLLSWPLDRASAGRTLGGSHQTDLATTLTLGRSLGVELPEIVEILVAEVKDLETIREGLGPEVADAVPQAVVLVQMWVESGALAAPPPGEGG